LEGREVVLNFVSASVWAIRHASPVLGLERSVECVKSQPSHQACLILVFRGEKPMTEQENVFRAYLQMALFCEKVLKEADNVVSIIRIIDRFTVPGATPEMPPSVLTFTIVISFKSGFMRGKQTIAIRPKSPTGADLPAMEFPVLFEGDDDRGITMAFPIQWSPPEEGLYWWDVYLNQEMVTRMPLRVIYQRMALPMN